MSTIEQTLLRLQQSAFRAKFHLSEKDRQYIMGKGMETFSIMRPTSSECGLRRRSSQMTANRHRCAGIQCLLPSMPAPAAVAAA